MRKNFPNSNIVSPSSPDGDNRQAQMFLPDPSLIKMGGVEPWRNGKPMKQGDILKTGSETWGGRSSRY